MINIKDLKQIKYYKYPLNTYAKIQSLKGCVDEIEITAEAYCGKQQVYITKYNNVKCLSIFNPFVCDYYTDDVYTILKE